jgi:predicted Zn-dependent protease
MKREAQPPAQRLLRVAVLAIIALMVGAALVLRSQQGVGAGSAAAACVIASFEIRRGIPWLAIAGFGLLGHGLAYTWLKRLPSPKLIAGDPPYRQVELSGQPLRFPTVHFALLGLTAALLVALGGYQTRVRCNLQLPATCARRSSGITLVPLGKIPAEQIASLERHFAECYQLPVAVAPARPLPDGAFNEKRSQWSGEMLMESIAPCPDGDPLCTPHHVIGITSEDIYSEKESWFYAYTLRDSPRRVSVTSTARLDAEALVRWGGTRERLRKLVAKTVALEYCGLPLSNNPKSVLYGGILGPDDLDRQNESVW